MGRFETEAASAAFDAVAAHFAGRLDVGMMMGRRTLRDGGRMIACLDADGLGIRLGRGTPVIEQALAVPGATLFAPGRSAPFRDWASLPTAQRDRWAEFVERALSAPPAASPRAAARR
ncbi:MAG: hypothetical protein QM635_02025 [Microbacteriaceae bacterium]